MGQATGCRRFLCILRAASLSFFAVFFWELHREAYGAAGVALTEVELSSEAIAQGDTHTPPEGRFQDTSSTGSQGMQILAAMASGVWTYDDPNLVAFSFGQSATNVVRASVNFGELKAASRSDANRTGRFLLINPDGSTRLDLENPYELFASGDAFVSWEDAITITSNMTLSNGVSVGTPAAGLPAGAPVEVEIGESLHSQGTHVGNCTDANVEDQETLKFNGPIAGSLFLQQGPCDYPPPPPGAIVGSGDTVSTTINLQVGDTLSLEQFLDASTSVIAGPPPYADGVFAGVDASDTGYFILDILTPGASYVSDSGTAYLTQFPAEDVPEPSSFWLLGAGLAPLWWLRRHRKTLALTTRLLHDSWR